MEFEAVDSCIQRSLSALYPPFEETAATLLGQVFDVLEKTYQNDALRYIIDFFIPAKHILQTIQQQACEPYASRRFTHAGWPLCQRGLVLVQLSALDWRQLQPGDFYLQLAPPPPSPSSSPLGRGARLLLKWPGAEGPVSEPVDEASYPHLFTAEWLDGVNRRLARGDSGHRLLEWCLAAEGGRLQRLPWRRVIYPQLEPEGGPGREPGPRPPAVGTRRRPSGDGADAEPRAEAALKRGLGNGQESGGDNGAPDGEVYCSGAGSDDPEGGDEGEYVELSEASPQRGPAFPRWRRACTGPVAVATTLPAPGGRRRRSGAQVRRGAWLHRRQRRQPDSGSGSKWKSSGKAPARCRNPPVDGGRARRHRRPEEGPVGEEWVRRLAQVQLAGGKEGLSLGATGLADLAWRESLALEGAGDLSESSNQMAGTQSEVGPKPGCEGTGLVEASMHSLAEMDISLCRAEWRLVEVCESEVGAESSLGARGTSDAGIVLSGLASTQTVVDQSSVCRSSSSAEGISPKPRACRSLAEGNSPKSAAKQHALTFGNDPSLDRKQTGSELPLDEKSLPAAVTEIPLSPESMVEPESKHSVSSARKSGLKTGTGQGTSPETQQSLAEEGLLTTGTERSLANPEVSADQHLSEQPAMETGSGQVTPERGSVQRAVVTGTGCSLAARGQLSTRDQQPLAERVATNTGIEGPLAERVVPVIGIEQPLAGSRADCLLGGCKPSTAGPKVPLAGCNRSDSSPQGSQFEQWQPARGSERRPLLAGQTQRPTAAPEGGDETLLDPQRGKARPTDAGKSPAPTAPGLASAWKRHEEEEESRVEPALHNHRGDQTACQEAREEETHSEKVPQGEQSNSSTEEGPISVRPSGDKGGGKDLPRQAPSVPAYHKIRSMTLPLPGRAAQQLSKVSCPRWSEVSLPPAALTLSQSSEVSSPQLPEVSSSEPSKVSSPQPPESLTPSIKVPSPQLSAVPSSQLSKLSSPQLPEVALSQSSEVPSPQLPNAPSLQLPEVPSPLLPEITSCQASEVPSPPLPQVPSPATGNVHSPQPPDAASCQTAEVSPQPLGLIPSPHLPEVLTPRPSEVSAHPLPQDLAATGRENSDAAEESEPLGLDGDLAVDPCPAASLKVDLDVLRSEVLSLPGSRDRDGRALVIVAARNPEPQDPSCTSAQLAGVLLYLHSISRKETQERGLRVLMDARGSWPAATIWKALDTFQQTVPGGIHSVLVLMGKERPTPKELPLGFQVEALPSLQALHERVEPAQLTAPFGGSFRYSHQKWVRFRLSLESLVQACRTSIQFLRSTTFQLEAKRLPENEKEVTTFVEEDQVLMRRVLQDTRLTGLQQEGAAILVKLKREMVTNSGLEDHRDAMKTTCALYEQVDEEVHRLVQVSNQRLKDLEGLAEFWWFEGQFREVCVWLREVGKPQLEKGEEMEDSLPALWQRQQEFRDFSRTALEHSQRAQRLLQGMAHWDQEVSSRLQPYADKLRDYRSLVTQFTERLEHQRLHIERTIRLHEFFRLAYSWCPESPQTPGGMSPEPGPSADDLQQPPPHPDSRLWDLAKVLGDRRLLDHWPLCWAGDREGHLATSPGPHTGGGGRPPPSASPRRGPEGSASLQGSSTPWPERRAVPPPLTPWLSAWSLSGSPEHPPPSSPPQYPRHSFSSSSSSSPDVRAPRPLSPLSSSAVGRWRDPAGPLKKAQSFELAPPPSPSRGGAWPKKAGVAPSRAAPGVLIRGLEVSSTQLVDRTCSPREHVMLVRRGEIQAEAPWGGSPIMELPAKSRARRALTEALLAEREYVGSLELVLESYRPELDRPDAPPDLRGKAGLLFGNLEKLLAFHRERLLPEMEGCASCPLRLGDAFLRHKEQFALYALYAKNKPQSDALLASHGNAFFKRRQLLLRDRTDLAGHLLKPVQRLVSYGLLLRELLAECGEDAGRDRLRLQAAIDMVDFQLRHGNDLLAMDAIRGSDVNLKEQGGLLRRDHFTVCCGRRKSLRHVFLFEELVVFTKWKRAEDGSESYVYKSSLKTAEMGLTENIGDSGLRFELWFRRRRSNEALVFQAESPGVKQAWTQDIARILWRQASRNKELRLQEMVSMGMGSKVFLDLAASDGALDQGGPRKGKAAPE